MLFDKQQDRPTTCGAPHRPSSPRSVSGAKWPSAAWGTSCAGSRAPMTDTTTSRSGVRRSSSGPLCCSRPSAAIAK